MGKRAYIARRAREVRIQREKPPLHQGYCTCGKLRYTSKGAARKRLKVTRKVRRSGLPRAQPQPGKTLERAVYLCPLCDGWHLTSQEPHKPPVKGEEVGEQ